MTIETFTLTRFALRGRSMGVLACSAFGALWASSALSTWSPPMENMGYALIALITALLMWAMISMLRRSRSMTTANDPAPAVQKRTRRLFLLIFAAEIVLINIAAFVLGSLHALAYLMPVMAMVVGLHFYPLAQLFRLPRYHVTATLMTLAGLAGVVAIAMHAPASLANAMVDAACAATLWVTGFFSWRSTVPAANNTHIRHALS